MAARRRTAWLATTLLTVSLLGACGGSDDESAIKPTTAAPTTAAASDPDGLSPEQREVADAVQSYSEASLSRGSDPVADSAVAPLVTPDLLDTLSAGAEQQGDAEKLDFIGTVTLAPSAVTIQEDTATYKGCQDGSQAYLVKAGQKEPGVGSRNVGWTQLDIKLVREDGRWLVDDPQGESVASC